MSTTHVSPSPDWPASFRPAIVSLAWSVRREVWEHRFLVGAPVGVAALILIGFVAGWPFGFGATLGKAADLHKNAFWQVYGFSAFILMIKGGVVGTFYCLDALHGERRNRSILFFKSLPVSDLKTVLSKLLVPMLVLPVLIFVTVIVLSAAEFLAGLALLAFGGHSTASVWAAGPFSGNYLCFAYGLTAISLWYAPYWCALLLVSVWARSVPFLWVVLPITLIGAVDRYVFGAQHVWTFLTDRSIGWFWLAFDTLPHGNLARDPVKFFTSPELWLGLLVAALLFAATVRLRRRSTTI